VVDLVLITELQEVLEQELQVLMMFPMVKQTLEAVVEQLELMVHKEIVVQVVQE
tara:strand:- start:51 stop:212 length:162 start_codon:yes stop_codon:yes gene_type:complete